MSSNLTRSVFRRLLRGQVIHHQACLHRPRLPTQLNTRFAVSSSVQQRFIFGFGSGFQKPSGWSRSEESIRQHLNVLLNTSKQLNHSLRTGPRQELATAWTAFFNESNAARQPITDLHAEAALSIWEHLQYSPGIEPLLGVDDAKVALSTIAENSYQRSDGFLGPYGARVNTWEPLRLKGAYASLINRLSEFLLDNSSLLSHEDVAKVSRMQISSLARAGYIELGLQLLTEHPSESTNLQNWRELMHGCERAWASDGHFQRHSKDDQLEALSRVIKAMNGNENVPDGGAALSAFILSQVMVLHRAGDQISPKLLDFEFLNKSIINHKCPDEDVIGLIEAALFHWPPEETPRDSKFKHDMDNPLRDLQQLIYPDAEVHLIKKLYDCKIGLKFRETYDCRAIEKLVTEAREAGVSPDGQTLIMLQRIAMKKHWPQPLCPSKELDEAKSAISLIEPSAEEEFAAEEEIERAWYDLSTGNPQSAIEQYQNLQDAEIQGALDQLENTRLDLEDRILYVLSRDQSHWTNTVDIINDIIDKRPAGYHWRPAALESLARFHLFQEDYDVLVELLRRHLPLYLIQDRNRIIEAIIEFPFKTSLDKPNEAKWNCFVVLSSIEVIMGREVATHFLVDFIKAGYVDEAMQSFNSLREAQNPSMRADETVYIKALEAFGDVGNLSAVKSIYNQLKVDIRIEPSIPLWNALINAFTQCYQASYALTFWDDMLGMEPGPNWESAVAALTACEFSDAAKADIPRIWSEVRERNLHREPRVLAAYIAALITNGEVDQAKKNIDNMKGKADSSVPLVLAYLLDAASPRIKDDVVVWIQANFPGSMEKVIGVNVEKKMPVDDVKLREKLLADERWE